MTTPIARWLRETRLRQTNPDTGRPWSQEYLVQRVVDETGWNLYGSNYVAYETGRQKPGAEILQRFVDFWQAHGEAGPDLTPEQPALSLEERQVLALERSAAAAERQAAAMELHVMLLARQTVATEAIALRQGADLPTGPAMTVAEEAILAYGQSLLDRRQSRAQSGDRLPAGEG